MIANVTRLKLQMRNYFVNYLYFEPCMWEIILNLLKFIYDYNEAQYPCKIILFKIVMLKLN